MVGLKNLDVSPGHRTSEQTVWHSAFQARNNAKALISQFLQDEGLAALVTTSENGVYPPWVRVEAWLPPKETAYQNVDARLRSLLEFHFDAQPYRVMPVCVSARLEKGGRAMAVTQRPSFPDRDILEWLRFALGDPRKPSNYTPILDVVANMFLSVIPGLSPLHFNKVRAAYRSRFTLSTISVVVGIMSGIWLWGSLQSGRSGGPELLMPLLLVIASLFGFVIAQRRPRRIAVIDRPAIPPRRRMMMDSWHAVVPELGSQIDILRSRIAKNLHAAGELSVETEVYGFRTPNGFEERERLVITKGQGLADIHIYRFGRDAFVGWDSYFNWAQWVETDAVSRNSRGGEITEFRGLAEGLYIPNQFDLIDLNSLTEIVHRRVVAEIKAMMEEHRIDREIDFTIIRGDRDAAFSKDRFEKRRAQEGGKGTPTTRRWRIS